MAAHRVTCITKPASDPRHEAITHLGGDGWKHTVATVISNIETNTHTYYTFDGSKASTVEVVKGPTAKYVRADADSSSKNNLLSLPACT